MNKPKTVSSLEKYRYLCKINCWIKTGLFKKSTMQMNHEPIFVSASLVVYNNDIHELQEAINSFLATRLPIRLFIIDNSPTERVRQHIVYDTRIEYIHTNANIGYGAGHNIGLRKATHAGTKYHVVLNPDIQFGDGLIEKLVKFAESHTGIGMITPNVVYPDGRPQYLCKLLPTPFDIFGRRLLPAKLMAKRNYKYEMRATGYKHTRNVPCLSGCFMFLDMEVIARVGLFDESYFLYFEDFDLIRRIHQVAKTVFYPQATVMHKYARAHATNKKILGISIQSAIRYFNKWGWFFDRERKKWNEEALDDTNIIQVCP